MSDTAPPAAVPESAAPPPAADTAPPAPTIGTAPTPPADVAPPVEVTSPFSPEAAAKIAALEKALFETANTATLATQSVESLRQEALAARRSATFAKIGLPDAYHALATDGDPADPAYGDKIEAWAQKPEYAHLLQSREPIAPTVDTSKFGVGPDGKSSAFTNAEHARSNWDALNRRGQ